MKYTIVLFFFFCASIVFAQDGPLPTALPADREIIPILIYHAIRPVRPTDTPFVLNYVCTPETLEKELSFLKAAGYTSISFADLVAHFKSDKPLPKSPIIISFDDSWEDQYTYGVPLLIKYGFKATFFIIAGAMGAPYYMTWDEVKMLSSMGMEIGGHTWSHPYLVQIRRLPVLDKELVYSKKVLEDQIGKPITAFAYPYGLYNDVLINLLKKAGYTSARTTYPGIAHSEKDLFNLTGLIRTENMAYFTNDLNEYFSEYEDIAK
jgi:peptidoglycan/xylan/chitin deacetylase (PgdA/CDA1 family)